MFKFLKRLFCRHHWKRSVQRRRNFNYGSTSFTYYDFCVCKCTKCGKKKLLKQYHWVAMN